MKRLPAFTIPELMVVMLLSGIVISAMYVLLQFSFVNYFKYYKSTDKLNQISRMNYLLTKDFNTSGLLKKTSRGFEFIEDEQVVSYTLLDSMLVRMSGTSDTLFASQISYELFLEDQPVLNIGDLSNRLLLSCKFKEEELRMPYYKSMDAKSYLQIEEIYGNRPK